MKSWKSEIKFVARKNLSLSRERAASEERVQWREELSDGCSKQITSENPIVNTSFPVLWLADFEL